MSKATRTEIRLPPMEAIVTRNKSAQLKRQLRNKDQSIIRINQITQLLRSPGKTAKTPPAKNKSPVNTVKNSSKGPKTGVSGDKIQSKSPTTVSPTDKNTNNNVSCQNTVKITRSRSAVRNRSNSKFQSKLLKKVKNIKELPKPPDKNEYYPDHMKRKLVAKKVVLKPRHELKMVGGVRISKRKLAVPQKGIKSPPPSSKVIKLEPPDSPVPSKPRNPGLTIEDLVRIYDESESLNDEDLLEILTCPSPVWWEDPLDETYIEDAIFSRTPPPIEEKKSRETNKRKRRNTFKSSPEDVPELDFQNTIQETEKILEKRHADGKFLNKRNKLENLLSNIKNKSNNSDVPLKCGVSDVISDTTIKSKSKTDKSINDVNKTDTETMESIEKGKETCRESDKNYEKPHSESTDGDDPLSSFRDDDILNDLENIDIPIESVDKSDDNNVLESDTEPLGSKSADFLGSVKNVDIVDTPPLNVDKLDSVTENSSNDSDKEKIPTTAARVRGNFKVLEAYRTLVAPHLPKFSATSVEKCASSAKSSNSITSENTNDSVSVVSNNNLDSISDTNKTLKLDKNTSNKKPEVDPTEINNKVFESTNSCNNTIKELEDISSNNANETEKDSKGNHLHKSEYMTVFKIISNDEFRDIDVKTPSIVKTIGINEHGNVDSIGKNKLDLFFKKYRNSNKKPCQQPETTTPNTDIHLEPNLTIDEFREAEVIKVEKKNATIFCEYCNPTSVKSIKVPDSDKMKYCMKCSCLFETENCTYCPKKVTQNLTCKNCHEKFCCDKSYQSHSKCRDFSCDYCNFKAIDRESIIRHLADHSAIS